MIKNLYDNNLAFFGNFDERYHTYKNGQYEIEEHWKRYISMDWGINDFTALYWYAIDEQGLRYCYREYYQNNKHVEDVGQIILDLTGSEEIEHVILPHDLFRKQPTAIRDTDGVIIGDTPAEVLQDLLPYTIIKADSSRGSRKRGWRATHRMLYLEVDENNKKHPRLIINENCEHLISQLKTIETMPTDMEEIRDGQEDHAVDSFRYYSDTDFSSERSYKIKEKTKENTPAHTKELIENKELSEADHLIYY